VEGIVYARLIEDGASTPPRRVPGSLAAQDAPSPWWPARAVGVRHAQLGVPVLGGV